MIYLVLLFHLLLVYIGDLYTSTLVFGVFFISFLAFTREARAFSPFFDISKTNIELNNNLLNKKIASVEVLIAFLIAVFIFFIHIEQPLITNTDEDCIYGFVANKSREECDLYTKDGKKYKIFKNNILSKEGDFVTYSNFKKKVFNSIEGFNFDYNKYLKSNLYSGYFFPELEKTNIKEPEDISLYVKFKILLSKFRKNSIETLNKADKNTSMFLSALLFANNSKWITDITKDLGILHLFVISGFHFSLIAGTLKKILRKLFPYHFHVTNLVYIIFSMLFFLVNPFSMGTFRAFIMSLFDTICFYINRKNFRKYTLLLVAGLISIFIREAVTQLSFVLSFFGTFLIFCLANNDHISKIKSKFIKEAVNGTVISLLMLPVVYVYTKEIPLAQFLLMPLLSLFISAYMGIGIIYFLLKLGGINILDNVMWFFSDVFYNFLKNTSLLATYNLKIDFILGIGISSFIFSFLVIRTYFQPFFKKTVSALTSLIISIICAYLQTFKV